MYDDPCPFLALADAAGTVYCGSYFGQLEERSLADGDRTGRTLDPQIGGVGDLSVSEDGRELIAFAAQLGVVSRWRLDGSGPVTRVVARGRVATDGYLDGRLLTSRRTALLAGRVPDHVAVWDPTRDEPVARVTGAADAVWVTSRLIGVRWPDDAPDLYDVESRKRVLPEFVDDEADQTWRSRDGSRLYVSYTDPEGPRPSTFRIRTFDARTLREAGRVIAVPGTFRVRSVAPTPDGSRLVVTSIGTGISGRTEVFDASSGARIVSGVPGDEQTVLSSTGTLVGASPLGELTAYDVRSLKPVGTFAGARGPVSSLQFSDDGRTLLVTSPDQTVQVYDVATRLRLGDPIVSESPRTEGWLRPDGDGVAVNTRGGVALWQLDAQHLAGAACDLAGRNLTRAEWTTYVGDQPYRKTCP